MSAGLQEKIPEAALKQDGSETLDTGHRGYGLQLLRGQRSAQPHRWPTGSIYRRWKCCLFID